MEHRPEERALRLRSRDADLALALQYHRAGHFNAASEIYHRVHAADRRDSEVIFLMGLLCVDTAVAHLAGALGTLR